MTSLPIFMRPQVKITEIDLTQRVAINNSTQLAVVGEFERGPLTPYYVTSVVENFTDRYGLLAKPSLSFAHDTVTTAMTQSTNCLVLRVTNSARHAGLSVVHDKDRDRLITFPFQLGTLEGYEENGQTRLILLSFSEEEFSTGNTFDMDVTDGSTIVAIDTVTFATDHNTTMTAIAQSVLEAMNTFAFGGTVNIYTEVTASDAPKWVIAIRPPVTADLTFLNETVAGGTTQPVVNLYTDASLFDVFAENPGEWANDYGIKLTNFDGGIRERFKLSLTGPLVAGNTFRCLVNETHLIEVPYAASSDATLASIAEALTNLDEIYSAEVETVPGLPNNDRTILIISQIPGADTLKFENYGVTGSGAPLVIVDRYLTGGDPDNTFNIELYHRDDITIPVERFEVSLQNQGSFSGSQQNIEYVINKGSTKSLNIRVKQNVATALSSFSLYNSETGEPPLAETHIRYLNGGDDGVACTSADISAAWNSLEDRTNWPFNVMLNAGYTARTVQKTMVALAEKRSDSIAVLDAPSDKQDANVARLYRINDLDIDSSYGAMYLPDVEIEDINTGERRFIPPSGPVGATYAYSDRLTNMMGAPAGLNRGKVTLALDLRHRYTNGELELLHTNQLNAIVDKKYAGPTVFDESTLQRKTNILSWVHSRRILNLIKTGLADNLEYILFDPLNEITRYSALQLGDSILLPFKKSGKTVGGLYDYRQVCDDSNNTPDVIDQDVLAYDVYLKITRIAKGIAVRAILTKTGASFEELADLYGGPYD